MKKKQKLVQISSIWDYRIKAIKNWNSKFFHELELLMKSLKSMLIIENIIVIYSKTEDGNKIR